MGLTLVLTYLRNSAEGSVQSDTIVCVLGILTAAHQFLNAIFFLFVVIGASHAPLAQEYSKKGVPLSFRAKLWMQILNVTVDDIVSTYHVYSFTVTLHTLICCDFCERTGFK